MYEVIMTVICMKLQYNVQVIIMCMVQLTDTDD